MLGAIFLPGRLILPRKEVNIRVKAERKARETGSWWAIFELLDPAMPEASEHYPWTFQLCDPITSFFFLKPILYGFCPL